MKLDVLHNFGLINTIKRRELSAEIYTFWVNQISVFWYMVTDVTSDVTATTILINSKFFFHYVLFAKEWKNKLIKKNKTLDCYTLTYLT